MLGELFQTSECITAKLYSCFYSIWRCIPKTKIIAERYRINPPGFRTAIRAQQNKVTNTLKIHVAPITCISTRENNLHWREMAFATRPLLHFQARNIRFTMEENRNWNLETKDSPDPLPPLIKYVSSHELECFDSLNKDTESDSHTISPSLV